MRAFLAVTPFLLLLVLLWTAWRVLEVFRGVLVPARIARIEPARDGTGALLLFHTQEPGSRNGDARLEVSDARDLAPGGR